MTALGNQFIRLVKEYHLDDRDPNIRKKVRMIEMGLLSDSAIKILINRIQPLIEKQRRCFNPLPQAPTQEELGKYDIELGELIENPGVKIGINLLSGPKHIHICGRTGVGKSNLIKGIIYGIEELKKNMEAVQVNHCY